MPRRSPLWLNLRDPHGRTMNALRLQLGMRRRARDYDEDEDDNPYSGKGSSFFDVQGGVLDATSAFVSAVANSNGIVPVPNGTYRLPGSAVILLNKAGLLLEGESRDGTILLVDHATADIFSLTAKKVTLRRLTFVANVTRTAGTYVTIDAADALIEDCDFQGWFRAVLLGASSDKGTVRECSFSTSVVANDSFGVLVRGVGNKLDHLSFAGADNGTTATHAAVVLGDATAAAQKTTVKDVKVSAHRHGVLAQRTGVGMTSIEDVECSLMRSGSIVLAPLSGQFVDFTRITRPRVHSSVGTAAHGLWLISTAGGIRDVKVSDASITVGSLNSYGCYAEGTGTERLVFDRGEYAGCQQGGIYVAQLKANDRVKFHGVRAFSNGFAGIRVGPGVKYDLNDCDLDGIDGVPGSANGYAPGFYDNDDGAPGSGKGPKRGKRKRGNRPDEINDLLEGLTFKGDGTDESATFQAYYDALPANGGPIELPEGEFRTTLRTWTKPIHLRGKGQKATIIRAIGLTAEAFRITVAGSIIENLTIEAEHAAPTAGALVDVRASSSDLIGITTIRNATIKDGFVGLQTYQGANGLRAENVSVETDVANSLGIWLQGGTNHALKECTVDGKSSTMRDGFLFGSSGNALGKVSAAGCRAINGGDVALLIVNTVGPVEVTRFEAVNFGGILLQAPNSGLTVKNVILNKVSTEGGSAGILISGLNGATIEHVYITDPNINGASGDGIIISSVSGASIRDIHAMGGKITDCGDDGISWSAGTGLITAVSAKGVRCKGNSGYGLRISSGVTQYRYTSNDFKGNTTGNVLDEGTGIAEADDNDGDGKDRPNKQKVNSQLLVNPGFERSTRFGTSNFSPCPDGTRVVDCWEMVIYSATGASFNNVLQETNPSFVASDSNASLGIDYTYGGNNESFVRQKLEDFKSLAGKTITFSMEIRSSVVNKIRLMLYDGVSPTYGQSNTTTGSFELLTVTHKVASNPATLWVCISFIGSGVFYLDNGMLVFGPVGAAYVPFTPQDDEARCQRYICVLGKVANGYPNVSGSGHQAGRLISMPIKWPQEMMATPTASKNGTWGLVNCGQPTLDRVTRKGARLYIATTAAGDAQAEPDSADDYILAEAYPS